MRCDKDRLSPFSENLCAVFITAWILNALYLSTRFILLVNSITGTSRYQPEKPSSPEIFWHCTKQFLRFTSRKNGFLSLLRRKSARQWDLCAIDSAANNFAFISLNCWAYFPACSRRHFISIFGLLCLYWLFSLLKKRENGDNADFRFAFLEILEQLRKVTFTQLSFKSWMGLFQIYMF